MSVLLKNFVRLSNIFGMAWWAMVETDDPEVIYWFGPFLSRNTLKVSLSVFLEELSLEGASPVDHSPLRCRRNEPLTF